MLAPLRHLLSIPRCKNSPSTLSQVITNNILLVLKMNFFEQYGRFMLSAAEAGNLQMLRRYDSLALQNVHLPHRVRRVLWVRNDNRKTSLHLASENGRVEICQWLLERAQQVNERNIVNYRADDNETALC